MKKPRTILAFSLIEMMVSLVAVSVLLAAFVPVITKRVKPKVNIAASSNKFTQNCEETFSTDCIFCDSKKRCLICNKTCTSGNYKDFDECACKPCSSIDANCNSCSDGGICNSCINGYLLEDNTCAPCPEGFYCTAGTKTPCLAGYYCVNGIKTPCDPGKWSDPESSSCNQNCSEGFYCKAGEKKPCDPGKWSNAGSSSCALSCPTGYACNNGVKTQCESGTYVSSGAKTCSSCESGYYCPDGKSRLTCESKTPNCSTCDSKTGACSGCGSGFDWDGSNCVSSCPSNCTSCTSSGKCTRCKSGYREVCGLCFDWSCPSGYQYSHEYCGGNSPEYYCVKPGTYSGTVGFYYSSPMCYYHPEMAEVSEDGTREYTYGGVGRGYGCRLNELSPYERDEVYCSSETEGASCSVTID